MKLINQAPPLQEDAVRRIALMLDMTTTFYAHNYSRFAFCVYAIVHELSLALIKSNDTNQIEEEYRGFMKESKEATLKMLDLNESTLINSEFVACTSISGTHAYIIALQLATKMNISGGTTPRIKTYAGNYFEYEFITRETSDSEADVWIFSAGPMMIKNGLRYHIVIFI